MLYVYVIVCCFRAHSISYRFDSLPSETLITFSTFLTSFQENIKMRFFNFQKT